VKVLLMTALLACEASAAALSCTTVDYAQYEDKAATDSGLKALAGDYCLTLRTLNGVLARSTSRVNRRKARRVRLPSSRR
jgi:hypothetical protein